MTTGNSLDDLAQFREDLLVEIVKEGEVMMQAQLQSHLASDQRAFTFGGLALTAATAALGASIALIRAEPPDRELARIAAWLAAGLLASGGLSIATARPRTICLPGNEPRNWHPDHWPPSAPRSTKQVRLEQAKIIQSQITQNRESAKLKARSQLASFALAYLTCLICAVFLVRSMDLF